MNKLFKIFNPICLKIQIYRSVNPILIFFSSDYRDRRVERQRRWPEALFRRLATLHLSPSISIVLIQVNIKKKGSDPDPCYRIWNKYSDQSDKMAV